MATNDTYAYQQAVAAQAHKDAVAALAASQQKLKTAQEEIFNTALTSVLSPAEIKVLIDPKTRAVNVPEDRKAAVSAKAEALANSNPAFASLQKKVEQNVNEVKTTQLTLGTATNNLQISQGKASGAVSPITYPSVKQPPYNVDYPTPNNGSILNNPTGLIVGTVALQAVVQSGGLDRLVATGQSIFGSNNITPVTSNVSATPQAASSIQNPYETQQAAQAAEAAQAAAVTTPADQENPYESQLARDAADNAQVLSDGSEAGVQEQINILNAQKQSTLQARQNQPSSSDWRVRLQLAAGADYLYKAKSAGILQPLAATDGVVFPYTPSIETTYQAKYNQSDLTHSNYRGYFYQSSYIDHVNVRGVFTAQDTREANYLLAVIHFFRSVTKMFYGKDPQAGTPPPLVYLSGLGQYQFNDHPCVVSNFTYSLPSDVDYIRAGSFNNIGIDLLNRANQSSGPAFNGVLGGFLSSKLGINGLSLGGIRKVPSPSAVNQNVNTTNSTNSTYVPTKMEISITLLPIQTRNQVSKQFSLENFANGNLLEKGFW